MVNLTNITSTALSNEKMRGRYISQLKTCRNPELRERGFKKLIDFYLTRGNLRMAGYCYECLGLYDDASRCYAKGASERIQKGRVGEKTFSDLELDIDVSLNHPEKIDAEDLEVIERFLGLNQNINTHILHIYQKARKICKAKSRERKRK